MVLNQAEINEDVMGSDVDAELAQQQKRTEVINEYRQKKTDYPSAWKETYDESKADEDFVLNGNQLTPQQGKQYGFGKNFRMPNMLKPYINNQANETLQNDYRAVVSPNGGGADITKARLREQVLRGVQRVGGAPEVYNYGRRGQLAGGIHYSKVVVDYQDYRGMGQQYEYEDVQDTYSCFPDPYVQKCTFADMKDFLIREDVPKGSWEEKTGKPWNNGSEKTHPIWFYWRRVKAFTDKEYIDSESGNGVLESELPLGADNSPDLSTVKTGSDGSPFSRDIKKYQWEWFVIDDSTNDIYNEGEWLGECSPLVACTGEKIIKRDPNGVKVFYRSLAHDAKEPQIVYTICENIILLQLAKSPYPHYEIADGSIIIKQMEDYRQSAVIGDNDVIFRAFDDQNRPLPPPRRVNPDGVDPELLNLQQTQLQKIERILGIYDAALGQQTNEKSGVAIKERAKQSNLANYHFTFNFLEYVRQLGYVVLQSFPSYLTVKQVIPMLDNDDQMVMQEINGHDGISFGEDEQYRMVIKVIPDNDTAREAEAEQGMAMVDSPTLGPLIASVPGAAAKIIKMQPGRLAQELSTMMEQAANDPQKQQMAQQIQKLKQAGQQAEQKIQQLTQQVASENQKHALDNKKIEYDHQEILLQKRIDAINAEANFFKATGTLIDTIPTLPPEIGGAVGPLNPSTQTGSTPAAPLPVGAVPVPQQNLQSHAPNIPPQGQ